MLQKEMVVLDRFKWIFSSLKLYWFIISFQTAMHYREVSQKLTAKKTKNTKQCSQFVNLIVNHCYKSTCSTLWLSILWKEVTSHARWNPPTPLSQTLEPIKAEKLSPLKWYSFSYRRLSRQISKLRNVEEVWFLQLQVTCILLEEWLCKDLWLL